MEGANGRHGGATGKPGGSGKESKDAIEVTQAEATGKVGAREMRWGRGKVKEEGKPGGANTKGKEDGIRATGGAKGVTGKDQKGKNAKEEEKNPNQTQ